MRMQSAPADGDENERTRSSCHSLLDVILLLDRQSGCKAKTCRVGSFISCSLMKATNPLYNSRVNVQTKEIGSSSTRVMTNYVANRNVGIFFFFKKITFKVCAGFCILVSPCPNSMKFGQKKDITALRRKN